MSDVEAQKYVVMADVHGSYEAAARALDSYDLAEVTPVFAGDFINGGPSSARVIQLIEDSGAIALAGNHEHGLFKVLTSPENCDNEDWRVGIHKTLLSSYGLRRTRDRMRDREQLHAAMQERGHLAVIESMRPYLETETAIIVHAGLEPTSAWEDQKEELDAIWTPERRHLEKPAQIFDLDYCLASLTELPETVTAKDVASGHFHLPPHARRMHERRIHLGSAPPLNPIFALELPARQITVYSRF